MALTATLGSFTIVKRGVSATQSFTMHFKLCHRWLIYISRKTSGLKSSLAEHQHKKVPQVESLLIVMMILIDQRPVILVPVEGSDNARRTLVKYLCLVSTNFDP